MGGTCAAREEPGKQNTRSCLAQELARSSAQEKVRQKNGLPYRIQFGLGIRGGRWGNAKFGNT